MNRDMEQRLVKAEGDATETLAALVPWIKQVSNEASDAHIRLDALEKVGNNILAAPQGKSPPGAVNSGHEPCRRNKRADAIRGKPLRAASVV